MLERTRGGTITVRSETSVSSCSTTDSTQSTASYAWSLVSTTATEPGGEMLSESRDPRVLVLPRHTLGFAGSSYVFQLKADFGGVWNAANVTGERYDISTSRLRKGGYPHLYCRVWSTRTSNLAHYSQTRNYRKHWSVQLYDIIENIPWRW